MMGQARQPLRWQPGDPIVVRLPAAGFLRVIYLLLLSTLSLAWFTYALMSWWDEAVAGLSILGYAIGAVTLVAAVFVCFKPRVPSPNRVVLEPAGIRWWNRRSSWAVAWTELAAVSIVKSKTYPGYGPIVTETYGSVWVRIDLFPGDPGFHHRHPELAEYWEAAGGKQRYRVPLGQSEAKIHELDNGLRMYAHMRYRGVVDEGLALEVSRDR
jgi:hypothetical protein